MKLVVILNYFLKIKIKRYNFIKFAKLTSKSEFLLRIR